VPNRGKLFVISGPSGVGKDTLAAKIVKAVPTVERVVTTTTREPRVGEVNGKHYRFVSAGEFDKRIDEDGFLEWATVHGNRYGSPRQSVMDALAKGKSLILAVDVQGAKQIKDKMREAVTIFIAPPSLKELENRLTSRSTEDAAKIAVRLKAAREELEHVDDYDFVVINTELGKAAGELTEIIKSQL
jgi:guanylate kinase